MKNETYGAKIFAKEYRAAVIVLLNEDGSWDVGYDGGLIECSGLLNAARIDFEEQIRRNTEAT